MRFRNRLVRVLLTAVTAGAVLGTPAVASATTDPIPGDYQASGGAAGPLGAATSAESCTLPGGGCTQTFQNGAYYWDGASPDAHYVTGSIAAAYASGGGVGVIGYPVTDPVCTTTAGNDHGCGQDFTGGAIYGMGDAYLVQQPLLASWNARGRLTSTDFPLSAQFCGLPAGGCGQHFVLGGLYRSSGTGTALVPRNLEDGYARAGGAAGWLGYPVGEARCPEGNQGCLQNFQGGGVVSNASYSTGYAVGGAIGAYWGQTGWQNGPLGYPASDIRCGARDGGCLQNFNHAGVAWSPASGAHAVGGEQGWKWALLGYENGWLGYPVSDVRCGARDGGCLQGFQGGAMATSSRGTFGTGGAIGAYWGGQRWENGPLGYPASDVRCGAARGGCLQSFEGGAVTWTPALGAHAVSGAIGSHWGSTGWENGPLGYPVADATCAASGCVQRFEGGTVRSNGYGVAWTQ